MDALSTLYALLSTINIVRKLYHLMQLSHRQNKNNLNLRVITITLFLLIYSNYQLLSQEVSLQIIDEQSGQGIPFVNIFFPSAQTGQLSDENGTISLNSEKIKAYGLVQISCLSYKMKELKIDSILSNNIKQIGLISQPYNSSSAEVVAAQVDYGTKKIGYNSKGNAFFDLTQLKVPGAEIGTIIRVEQKYRLDQLSILIKKIEARDFLVEINIYDFKDEKVGQLLQKERIFKSIDSKVTEGAIVFDLQEQELWVENDIFVSLRVLRNSKNTDEVIFLAGKTKFGRGLIRRSFSEWEDPYVFPLVNFKVSYIKE